MSEFDDLPDNAVDFFRAHIQLYLTDPARAHLWDSTPVGGPGVVETLLITTNGRRSGKLRHAPLLYVKNGSTFLVIASRGGTEVNPSWYFNLLEQISIVKSELVRRHTRARARVLDGDERDQPGKITRMRPVYSKYQARTTRMIPVVELTTYGEPIEPKDGLGAGTV